MGKEPKTIKLSEDELAQFSKRIEQSNLAPEDRSRLVLLLRSMCWLSQQLELGKLTIRRLKRIIFGAKTESQKNIVKESQQANVDKPQSNESDNAENDSDKTVNPEGGRPPKGCGHGRNGSDKQTGAETIFCQHGKLKAGDICPECKKGRLHNSIEPGIFVRFTGNAPITATIYKTERLRCGLCGKVFEASLPEGVPAVRWDETAKAMAAILRYGYGMPNYRQEKLQQDLGMPIADSVLWELAENVGDCGYAPYKYLLKQSAQGEKMNLDDTTCRILELMKENKELDPARTGIFTSALISKVGDHEITLFVSGRRHMGENIQEILKHRNAELPLPTLMTDGTNLIPDNLKAILANCLTHGRRHFVDLYDRFPTEVEYVINQLAKVYHFDTLAYEQAMDDNERLRFHQHNSKPVMDALLSWCQEKIANREVEPNGPLGKAIKYLEKRWNKLTLFLRLPGAELSNDVVERLIKRCVLHRKNSMFYKTQHGAVIGDILMTLIHTAVRAGNNPFRYLTELQKHRSDAHKNPANWLPWTYEATLAAT